MQLAQCELGYPLVVHCKAMVFLYLGSWVCFEYFFEDWGGGQKINKNIANGYSNSLTIEILGHSK